VRTQKIIKFVAYLGYRAYAQSITQCISYR